VIHQLATQVVHYRGNNPQQVVPCSWQTTHGLGFFDALVMLAKGGPWMPDAA
jgi:hypothetical protein